MTESVVIQIESKPGQWLDYSRTTPVSAFRGMGTKINGKATRATHWIDHTVLTVGQLSDMVNQPELYVDRPPVDYVELENEPAVQDDDDTEPFAAAYGTAHGVKFLNVYEMWREYGGPEEGGWYYDRGDFVGGRLLVNPSEEDHAQAERELRELFPSSGRKAYSVMYHGGEYKMMLEDSPGADYPAELPHYE